ncbi:carbohydrate ABC transporter permease [Paenibacillus piri]|uniref:Carbohydrate ABC transporter permease n=1 Tax=Paenibacillus piri TaxID=2547395 RepID=A0A4R5KGA9_9BACL|nr:carbohydrate ABC transporter permease [Paenibacillus piri]TDF94421.1 carbohydrate ABC transporter permease [Paenibacillus piri]
MIKTTLAGRLGYSLMYAMLAVCGFCALYPLVQVIAASFSSSRAISSGEVYLWPVEFTVLNYHILLKDGAILGALKNTVIVTVFGTLFNITATVLAAYPLSKPRLMGRNSLLMVITFTMLFTGGLIPHFILIKTLGLMNTYWALWLPALISTYNMFVMKTYFEGLPVEVEESASMDGAGDWTVLTKIILPLSKPMLAALSLFYAVYWWNSYFNVLIYISSARKATMMLKLYQMLQGMNDKLQNLDTAVVSVNDIPTPEGLKAAAIFIALLPILCFYPFLQKHFVKGVLIGSVKG